MLEHAPRIYEDYLDEGHVWCQTFAPSRGELRPALFLDRDGVLVEPVPYLHRAEDVVLIPGAAETIAEANRRGVLVVVVTNQAGVGRGYYGWREFQDVQSALLEGLHGLGAHLDGVFACPHHADALGIYAHPDHPARKPRPGMLFKAAEMLAIDLQRSWMAGDTSNDLEAGRAAGLCGGALVLKALGSRHREAAEALRRPGFEVLIAPSLREAATKVPLLA